MVCARGREEASRMRRELRQPQRHQEAPTRARRGTISPPTWPARRGGDVFDNAPLIVLAPLWVAGGPSGHSNPSFLGASEGTGTKGTRAKGHLCAYPRTWISSTFTEQSAAKATPRAESAASASQMPVQILGWHYLSNATSPRGSP